MMIPLFSGILFMAFTNEKVLTERLVKNFRISRTMRSAKPRMRRGWNRMRREKTSCGKARRP